MSNVLKAAKKKRGSNITYGNKRTILFYKAMPNSAIDATEKSLFVKTTYGEKHHLS